MDVMLVAAKKDIVEDYVSFFPHRLSPAILDVDAFALQNAFELSARTSPAVTLLSM